jgi:hypothetical protein
LTKILVPDAEIPGISDSVNFDAYNLTNEPLHDYFESDGNTFNIRYPGATYTIGVRGSFLVSLVFLHNKR